MLSLLPFGAVRAGGGPTRAASEAARDLGGVIASDGRVSPQASGAFDARGWRVALGPDGAPRFLRHDLPISSAFSPVSDDDGWDTRFGATGVVDGVVHAVLVDGNDVYIGGEFHRAGNVRVEGVARWDGKRWLPLGGDPAVGVNGQVLALAMVGENLYVGGHFDVAGDKDASCLAVWNRGTNRWAAVGKGFYSDAGDAVVNTLLAQDGMLYIGGRFSGVSTTIASNVARYDGTSFSRLGGGVAGTVYALAISGARLYVGGDFQTAGSKPARNLARWSPASSTWEAVGTGTDSVVYAIAVDGSDIYIGGHFNEAGGVAASSIVRFNENELGWHPVSTGVVLGNPLTTVESIVVDGNDVYVAGNFQLGWRDTYNLHDTVRCLLRYSKSANTWIPVQRSFVRDGIERDERDFPWVHAMVKSGRTLYFGGNFERANGLNGPVGNGLMKFDLDAMRWSGLGPALGGDGRAVALWNGDLYIGGSFSTAGTELASNIVRWRDGVWSPLGAGTDGLVNVIHITGGKLFAGGTFASAGGRPAGGLASWDGSTWQPVGNAVEAGVTVTSIAGTENDLYVGGRFAGFGGKTCFSLAHWNGTTWEALDTGLFLRANQVEGIGQVNALLLDGDQLYVGGSFTRAGTTPANFFAIWNTRTRTWSAPIDQPNGSANAIIKHQGRVIVGGDFDKLGDNPAHLAAYNPEISGWTIITAGVEFDHIVSSMASDGSNLYIAGNFTHVEDVPAQRVARWDGQAWNMLGSGVDWDVTSVAADSAGLYLAGAFRFTGADVSSFSVAHWTLSPFSAAPGDARDAVAGMMLGGIAPNPAATGATLSLLVPRDMMVRVELFAADGSRAATLVDGYLAGGAHAVAIRTDDLAEGVYLCRMIAGGRVETRTLMVRR